MYLIFKGELQSMCHSAYEDEQQCIAEVQRLEKIRSDNNRKIKDNPATGHGACFLNIIDKSAWTYRKVFTGGKLSGN